MKRRCLGCMEQYDDRFKVCPHCGYVVGTRAEEAIQMQPGTLLHDRYIIGKVLGSGGFGVTYLAWDGRLEQKVAVKEYLPGEFSTRMPGSSQVTVFNGDKGEQFHDGMKKLIEESKRLSKFQNEPGIVKIFDSFEENQTAYIVMEYLDGMTLASYLEHVGTIPEDEAVSMLMPLMASLQIVHEEGLLHRDIAPDNIFLTRTGEVKLIDFGAARYATTTHSRSLTVIIKPGYSPEEQYRSNGNQGAHTDVHALAATLYKMITGVRPADAMDRYSECETKGRDLLVPLHKFDKNISKNRENAILNGLNVRIEDRTADIVAFMDELNSQKPVKRRYGKIKRIDIYSWPLWMKILMPVSVVAIVICGILFSTVLAPTLKSIWTGMPQGYVKVPDVIGMTSVEAEDVLEKTGLKPKRNTSIVSDTFEPGKVIYQNPHGGEDSERKKGYWVYIASCRGSGRVEYDNNNNPIMHFYEYEDAPMDEVEKAFLKREWTPIFRYDFSDSVKNGNVISIEGWEDGQAIPKGTEIIVVVSKGAKPFEMPDYSGWEYNDAMDDLIEEYGVNPENIDCRPVKPESGNYEIGEVYKHEPLPGEKTSLDEKIILEYISEKASVIVEEVSGREYNEAEDILKEQGFKVDRREESSVDGVPEGYVIRTEPVGGSRKEYGETINVIVSSGPPKMYVTFFADGKECGQKEQTYGMNYILIKAPKKEGYVHVGWKLSEKDVEPLSASDTVNVIKDHKLYAEYEPQEYKVTLDYNYNNGTVYTKTIDVTYGKKYGDELPVILKRDDGYTFCGWSYTKTGEPKVNRDTIVSKTEEHPLYAQWDANALLVTYVDDDTGEVISTEPLKVGQKYNLPTKEKVGHKISKYYIEHSGTPVTPSSKVAETSDHTVCVKYEPKTIKITFDAGDGNIESESSSISVKYGSTLQSLPTAKKYYHTQKEGWYTKPNGMGDCYVNGSIVKFTQDTTLYAYYTKNEPSGWTTYSSKYADTSKYEIVDERWLYDLTRTDSGTAAKKDGWETYKSTYVINWKSSTKESTTKVTETETRKIENIREVPAVTETQYNYSRYKGVSGGKTRYGPAKDYWNGIYCGTYQERGWSTNRLSVFGAETSVNYGTFNKYNNGNDPWYNENSKTVVLREKYTVWTYREGQKVYTYYYIKTEKDKITTSSDPTGKSGVSNVRYQIMYIEK